MKQKIVFLIGSGIPADERDEAYGVIAEFKRDFEVTTIVLDGDEAIEEAGFSWEQAAGAVRTANVLVIAGASLFKYPVARLLGEMDATCRLFVISLEYLEWPDTCKGKQVLHLLRKVPVGLRRLKRWLLPIKIYVSDYGVTGYLDLKELVEQYPLRHGETEVVPEAYWEEERHLMDLLEILSQSVYYRGQIQKLRVAEILESWVEEAPVLRRACEAGLLHRALETCKKQMGDFMLVRMPKDTALTFNGKVYKGIEAIKQADGNGTVFSVCRLFPCFDSSDYAYENRYYRNYWFCGQDSSARAIVQSLEARGNHCYISEHLPKEVIPMVYYEDGREIMLVAYTEQMKALEEE